MLSDTRMLKCIMFTHDGKKYVVPFREGPGPAAHAYFQSRGIAYEVKYIPYDKYYDTIDGDVLWFGGYGGKPLKEVH